MTFEFKLPDIGEGIHEGEIVEWLVSEGDEVAEDQDIVEVMTDKATVQISSPRAGTIQTIHFQAGEVVDVGDVFVTIQETGEEAAPAEVEPSPTPAEPSQVDAEPEAPARQEIKTPTGPPSNGAPTRTPAGILAPPRVRIRARELGIDLTEVQGSGPAGRILLEDLETQATEQDKPPRPSPRAPPASKGRGMGHGFSLSTPGRGNLRAIEGVHLPAGSRGLVATRAQDLQPHFSYTLVVDADHIVAATSKASQAQGDGPTVDATVLLAQAVARALREHPRCNALVDEATGDLVIPEQVALAVARPGPDGMTRTLVPDAANKSRAEIAQVLEDEASGEDATVTLTDLGELGGIAATPVLAHPQVTAITAGSIREVARLHEGEMVSGYEMTLSFSFDHRYVDGYNGAVFAKRVAALLEAPAGMLLDAR
ncbi:MAG: dihydrolipoamide acetyltransferase family protein [Candidatus Thermoplasmatota archaeon]|nr:dihydrolipoamide acetyltransferase family protein [Candidatus Thermoplasmatota archaeon]